MTDADLRHAEQIARKYGAANCWTGTSGRLARWIIRLLNEVRWLKDEHDRTDAA
jgi:hypothetical protein